MTRALLPALNAHQYINSQQLFSEEALAIVGVGDSATSNIVMMDDNVEQICFTGYCFGAILPAPTVVQVTVQYYVSDSVGWVTRHQFNITHATPTNVVYNYGQDAIRVTVQNQDAANPCTVSLQMRVHKNS